MQKGECSCIGASRHKMCIRDRITRINEYNDILALWIKMRQGTLSLNIENFELNSLSLIHI